MHIDELIRALRSQGHRVVVVEPRRVDAMAETVERRLLPRAVYELAEFGYSVVEFVKLAAAAIRYRPDALYERANLYMLSGVWASRLFRLPYLLEVNAPLAEERSRHGGLAWPRLAAWTEHLCWRKATIVLPVTDALATTVLRAGVSKRRVIVTPNGVDTSLFCPHDTRAAKLRLGLDGRLVVGFVGYMREWHGLENILDLLAKRPALANANFVIVGDGPARSALARQAQELGLADRVRFTGIMPRKSLPEVISAFDIALQPEVTPYASPLKLFEYMAMSRAILAPATPNLLEILEHNLDAFLFARGDRTAMAAALERMAADPPLRDRLGAAALNKIVSRDLTWQGNARRVASLVRDLDRCDILAEEPA